MDELKEEMTRAIYKLTDVISRSIITLSNGYVGFLITKGAWYKLRVWEMEVVEKKCSITLVHSENFASEESAQKELRNQKTNYKSEGKV